MIDSIEKKVSVVVCVKNSRELIDKCLSALVKAQPLEIVVVDGKSTDGTLEVIAKYPSVICVSDEGRGISYARGLGVSQTSGDWVLMVGPDNIVDREYINNFIKLKSNAGYDVACGQTRVLDPKGYWDQGLDLRWSLLMATPGPVQVVGTPTVYDRKVFSTVQYTPENMGACDDTQFSLQMVNAGFRLGLLPIVANESNGWNALSTWKRFKFYGTGDFYFYRKNAPRWTYYRRLQSLTHPFRQTLRFSKQAAKMGKSRYIFWFLFAMVARYNGWVSLRLKAGKNKK